LGDFLVYFGLIISVLISISRILCIYFNYGAPVHIYSFLSQNNTFLPLQNSSSIVCVGKEWYRFPSHYFLNSPSFRLEFIKSGFDGQLPKHYSSFENATWIIPTDMNDRNLEEPSRYVCIKNN
jgi:alpha-1,2-mannosyltransferase